MADFHISTTMFADLHGSPGLSPSELRLFSDWLKFVIPPQVPLFPGSNVILQVITVQETLAMSYCDQKKKKPAIFLCFQSIFLSLIFEHLNKSQLFQDTPLTSQWDLKELICKCWDGQKGSEQARNSSLHLCMALTLPLQPSSAACSEQPERSVTSRVPDMATGEHCILRNTYLPELN